MKKLILALLLTVVFLLLANGATAQNVYRVQNTEASLNNRIDTVHEQARSNGDEQYWVAYSIHRQMREDSWMGHFSSDWKDAPTLAEILTGHVPNGAASLKEAARDALDRANGVRSEKLVEKEIVVLQLFRDGVLTEINQSNIELAYDFGGHNAYWLASVRDAQSVSYLVDAYETASDTDLKEDLVSAVAVHDDKERTRPFVEGVVESSVHNDVRETAVFWMSRYESAETIRYLDSLAENDRSDDVRENAVFALSRMKSSGALEGLIRLARSAGDQDVRENARFWLGQRASNELLGHVEDNDEHSKLQKQAVFALAQMDDDGGVDELIGLAYNHANPVVRKQAIFWLGQAESDRALDAIIELLKSDS